MTVRVEALAAGREGEYEELLHSNESALIYASLRYRRFLKSVLGDAARDCYLVATEGGRVVGALPAFVRLNPARGNVLNSLPFYGSHGGVIVSPAAADADVVKEELVRAFDSLAREQAAVASTLISNPLAPEEDFYERGTGYDLRDARTGQFTPLPGHPAGESAAGVDAAGDALMAAFHQKTRNAVRKAQKSGVRVSHSDSFEALRTLAAIHHENMAAIGGPSKPWEVFESIRASFEYERDYRVYLAETDGAVVSALLLFYFNGTVEYFTPATRESHRALQPASLLIYEAMADAARRGFRLWNWGGPGPSQPHIYNFKKRWGTVDRPYFYYTKVFDDSILSRSKSELLGEYPYFYVVPFGGLRG